MMNRGVGEIMWVARIEPARLDAPEVAIARLSEGPIAIRRGGLGDVPELLAMMAEFNAGEGIPWHSSRVEAALRRLVGEPNLGVVGVAVVDGAIQGYFIVTWGYDLEFGGRDAWLTEIFVRDGARRRGLGQRLLAAAEAHARAGDARALHLTVRPNNAAAQALYDRAGYLQNPRNFLSKCFD